MDIAPTRNQFSHPIFQALEKISGAVLWVDVAGKIVHVNDELLKLTGFSAFKLKNALLTKLEPRLDSPAFEQRWQALRKKQTAYWESEFVNVDGINFPVQLNVIQVEANDLVLGCIHVTPSRSSTKVDFLSECLSCHKIATWEWVLVSDSLFVSDFFYEFFGLEKGQQLSRENILHLLKPHLSGKQVETLKEVMNELRKSPFVIEKEVTLYHRDGTEKKMQLGCKPCFEQGMAVAVRGYFWEVAPEADDKAESLARKIMDLTTDMMFCLNADSSIRYANQAALKKLGYTEKEMADGIQWWDIAIETVPGGWVQYLKNIEPDQKATLISELLGKQGRVVLAECIISSYEINHDKVFFVLSQEVSTAMQAKDGYCHAFMETKELAQKLGKNGDGLKDKRNATNHSLVTLNGTTRNLLLNVEKPEAVPINGQQHNPTQQNGHPTGPTSVRQAKPLSSLEEMQRQHILDALEITGRKVSGKNGAADLLNVNAQTLFSKMKRLGIKLP